MAREQKRENPSGGERRGRGAQEKGRGRADRNSKGPDQRGTKTFKSDKPDRPVRKYDRPAREEGARSTRPVRKNDRVSREEGARTTRPRSGNEESRPRRTSNTEGSKPYANREGGKKSFGEKKSFGPKRPFDRKRRTDQPEGESKPRFRKSHKDLDADFNPRGGYISRTERDGLVRLNKFLSQAGIASRRDADELIALGLISVNGKVITELGEKINPQKDEVKYDDRVIRPEKYRYVLLNKPKGYLTTQDDPGGRDTVMDLVRSACKERIYPVGRMEKDAMGLLLFTNDGDMAKRLTHPKHDFPKLYQVELSERISQKDLNRLLEGVQLEDGFVQADQIAFVEGSKDGKQVGIRINSGRTNIVKRMFEHLGFRIKKLDRVMFAGLTKKDLTRGRYRHLSENEIGFLKMIR
jgi:23S rRNA pseudouridine2605 synthase